MKATSLILTVFFTVGLLGCSGKSSNLLEPEKQPRRVAPLSESSETVQPCDKHTLGEKCPELDADTAEKSSQ
ncbi:hypothetical protein [Thioflexithrix psekupsensis]|uniref:Uncharacterized protein n=1 Tax=Thioflexithrix psekupsensis TaxID=1570016 RepID=A0A251X583_9GAMM|nr:hypothetical protein [Thioflexithrix psekupsensis]OUD12581.1 hypothetical protein TPSD3_15980 [Thioflexithrix psekupsensis]